DREISFTPRVSVDEPLVVHDVEQIREQSLSSLPREPNEFGRESQAGADIALSGAGVRLDARPDHRLLRPARRSVSASEQSQLIEQSGWHSIEKRTRR